ncbi:MAG: KOW domain-containing RNA-binding protein [Bacillota bacterium]
MKESFKLGEVVYSIAGRDQGRFYAIVEITDDSYVKISDGVKHSIINPKSKKTKHLKSQDAILTTIAVKLERGLKMYDAEIKDALHSFNGSIN